MEKKCCICGNIYSGFGNNAAPIKDGYCCNSCNVKFVIPARIVPGLHSYEIVKSKDEFEKLKSELEKRDFEILAHDNNFYCFAQVVTEEKVLVLIV